MWFIFDISSKMLIEKVTHISCQFGTAYFFSFFEHGLLEKTVHNKR